MMGANDKVAAALYPGTEVTPPTPAGDVVIDANSVADMLCELLQIYSEEGGNDVEMGKDLMGEYVDEVTFGGRVITVDFSNGERFQIEVWKLPSMEGL